MSLNAELWIAMAAAALFYHLAVRQKAPTAVYVLASVAVSIVVMLVLAQGWEALLIAQLVLLALLLGYRALRGGGKS